MAEHRCSLGRVITFPEILLSPGGIRRHAGHFPGFGKILPVAEHIVRAIDPILGQEAGDQIARLAIPVCGQEDLDRRPIVALIAGEIGGITVLLAGFVAAQFF